MIDMRTTCENFHLRQVFMGGSETEPLRLEVDANDGTITAWINTSYHDSVRTFIEARIEDAKAESRFAAAHHTFKNGLSEVMSFKISYPI